MPKLTALTALSPIVGSDIGYFVSDPGGTPVSKKGTVDVLFTSRTITTPTISGAVTWPDDIRQTFNPGATVAGLNVGSIAGDPSTPVNGDLWYDSTANELTARINGANVALGAGGGGAPTTATYITQTPDATLSAEQALSALSSGIMRVATTTGVITSLGDVLPVANGGTGASTLTGLLQGNGTSAITGITNSSTVGQVLRVTGISTYAWGALDLADTDAVTGILAGANGGTGNGFFAVSGPATTLKTFTFPNASATVLTDNALVTVAQGGTGAGTLTGVLKGNGTSAFTAAAAGTDYVAPGAITGSGLTMATARLLGRTTAATGAIEELTAGTGLSLTGGSLSVSADTTVQKIVVRKDGGADVGSRRRLNFIQGSNVTLTIADDGVDNEVDVTIAASVSAGSRWDQIVDPNTVLALSHGANTTTFTWGAATSTPDLFTLRDTASNTGTGHVLLVNTASSSAAKPVKFTAGGTANGVEMDTTGSLVAIGTGGIVATTGDSATSFFSTGTLEDARLSSNVPLKGAVNTFTSEQLIAVSKATSFNALDVSTTGTGSGTSQEFGGLNFISSYQGSGTGTVLYGIIGQVFQNTAVTVANGYGVYARAFVTGAGATISNASAITAKVNVGSSGSIGNAYGLNLSGWTNSGSITTSYGIYMDSSIDVGTTKYALYSLSTSPSLLTGDLTVSGLLKLGSGPTTINDAAGKILSASLNTVAVGQGGTGATTFTGNGVLYGNTASAIQATAQGAANSILIANAGAPSFSQTPIINTSLQIGVASGTTGLLKLAVSGSANLTTIQAGDTPASAVVYKLPADDPAAGEFLKVTSFGTGTAVLEWATPAGAGTVTHTGGALTANAVVIGAGSDDVAVLASLGDSGQVLTSNGAGSPPSFQAAGGGAPGGSGSELQFRGGASTFSAVTGSSVSGGQITLADKLTTTLDNATTAAADPLLDIQHSSSGTVAAGFGARLRFGLESSTTVNRDAAAIDATWSDVADASRTSKLSLFTVTNAVLRESLSLSTGGIDILDLNIKTGTTEASFIQRLENRGAQQALGGAVEMQFGITNGPTTSPLIVGGSPQRVFINGPLLLGATDTAVSRNAAGVVEVNNGTAGQYRDVLTRGLRSNAVTFANAIAAPVEGTLQAFTDSSTNSQGATITGGGANHVIGYYNGTNWIVTSGTGGGGGATTALDNLASVSINASLIPQTTLDLGAAATAWRDLYLYGSGTFGTTSLKLTGTPTGARVITFPDSNTTVAISSQQITWSGPSAARTYTLPDAAATLARTDAANTFTGTHTFGSATSLLLGTAGSAVGDIGFRNATSGTITLAPVTGALGTVTLSLPAATDTLVGRATTDTLTNKRITPRVTEVTNTVTSVTIDVSTTDIHITTAQAGALLYNNPTGTPTSGQKLMIRIKDNGTARALTYDTQFRASSDLALPSTTILSKTLYMGFIWNAADTKWDLLAVLNNFT